MSEAWDGVKKTGEQPFKALPQFCVYAGMVGLAAIFLLLSRLHGISGQTIPN